MTNDERPSYAKVSEGRRMTNDVLIRAQKTKLLALDIDGVMTDGRIIYGDAGDELKAFDVQDGFGILLIKKAGIGVVIITAKGSKVVKRRAKDINADGLYLNATDKLKALDKVLKKFNVKHEEICFVGDDLIDIPVLKRVGLAVAVPNAAAEVKSNAHMITANPGGRGAVREVAEFLIKSQGKWDDILKHYLR